MSADLDDLDDEDACLDESEDDLAAEDDGSSTAGTPTVSGRSDLGSKDGEATDSPSPRRSNKTLTVGSGFTSPAWDLGDEDRTNTDPADRTAGKRYRQEPRIFNDLIREAHGFRVWKKSTNPNRSQYCRYCGDRLLPPDLESECEFLADTFPGLDGPVLLVETVWSLRAGVAGWFSDPGDGTPGQPIRYLPDGACCRRREPLELPAPVDYYDLHPWAPDHLLEKRRSAPSDTGEHCRCSGCVARSEGRRERGGPKVQCGKPECRRALNKDQDDRDTKASNKRDRDRARRMIDEGPPDLTDQEIAKTLGIYRVRVREARENIFRYGTTFPLRRPGRRRD